MTFFYFSLAVKSFGMALVFLPGFSSQLNGTKKILLTTVFLLTSGYFYYMLTAGIATYAIDKHESTKILPTVRRDNDPVFIVEKNAHHPLPETALAAEEKYLIKGNVIFNNFWYYTKNTFLLTDSKVISPKNTQLTISTVAGAFVFLSFIFIATAYFFKPARIDPLLGLGAFIFSFGFIPISGLSYVPHFRFSFTSPHWSYLPLVGAALIFAWLTKKWAISP
jgi:hypothetical protein